LLLVAIAAIAWRAWWLNSFPLSSDEGIHLIWLRLLSAGYEPYTEVYITYPPLYPLAIELIWQIWPVEVAQRWFSVAYALFGALGVGLIGRKFAGPLGGVVAVALTLFSPILFEPSRAILGEFPSVGWSVWAIWLAWLYRDPPQSHPFFSKQSGRRVLLILSGLCLAASLLTKFLSPFVAVLIPLMLILNIEPDEQTEPKSASLLRFIPPRPVLIDLLLWGLAVLVPIIISMIAVDVGSLFGQVIDQRLKARTAYSEDYEYWPPRYKAIVTFIQEDTALVILAVLGIAVAWRRRLTGLWIMVIWLGLAVLMLGVHTPIRYKHFLILIPPFAIFGGVTVDALISSLAGHFSDKNRTTGQQNWSKISAVAGLVLLIGLYVWQIPSTLNRWEALAAEPQPPADEVEALDFISKVTAPNDCLISDDMQLLYWSGRMAPPELAEVSSNRLNSGALTLEELMAISDRYDCQLVAPITNRIRKFLPDYIEWVKSKYLGQFHYGENNLLYFAKVDTDPNPATPLWADFDGQLIFHGYTLPAGAKPGDSMPLTLVWQAQTALETDYAIFVQLRDSANNTLASADHQPYLGLAPTSTWPAGAVIQEVTWLKLPPDLSPGQYNLYVGLYRPNTLERLPLQHDSSGENALIIGPVIVE